MKIAVVIPKYGLMGGAEAFAYEVTERLSEKPGFQIHVFANQWRQGTSAITFHKVPVPKFPRLLRQIVFAYASANRMALQDYNLIHSHDRIFQMDVLTMHGIPHKRWVRNVRHKHPSLFDRAMAWVEKKGLENRPVPMVLPVSTLVKHELLKVYGISESRIHVIHPGVSAERFPVSHKQKCRAEIRERHGLSRHDVVALFVGMNFEVKNLELVLRGMAGLKQKGNASWPVKLLVVGKGDETRYRGMARELGIADHLVFGGVTREVEKYFLASDFFTMPSIFDTFGLAVLEALAAGLPVIISRTVGARDLIEEGVNGFVLKEEASPADFLEKLRALLNKENRKKMGERARQTGLEHSWESVSDRVADLYGLCFMEKVKDQEKEGRP